jgi:hypothetical protein
MLKLGLASLVAAALATLSIVTLTGGDADAAAPCKRAKFETKMVADACKKGGQAEAKKVMKSWMKEAKKQDSGLTCASCHTTLAGTYPNKPDAVKKYKALGGK